MNVNEVLYFVDHLVVEKTGKHLDDVQKALVKGIWQRQSYDEIAKDCYVTKGHIGDVGSKLMQILSEELGKNIKKSNFRSTLERTYYLKSSQNPRISGSSNICNYNNKLILQTINKPQKQTQKREINNKSKSPHQDLSIAPKIIKFYPRDTELKNLSNWIFNQKTSLISVLGLSGIGKSYLVRRFVDLNLDKFEVIIWKSLSFFDSFDLLIDDIFSIYKIEVNDKNNHKLNQLFELLRTRKCLLIFDELEHLFMKGQLAGQCQLQYQDYHNFFQKIMETEHQSHIILISQEKCQEMKYLDCNLYSLKCLELSGLKDVEIFKNMGLKDEDSWLKLLNLYEGNPFYLQNIIYYLTNIFDGFVKDFLAEKELIITKEIEGKLELLFHRLSSSEKQILAYLSYVEKLVSREELKTNLEMSSTDLINGLESLQNRYLLKKIMAEKIVFKLSPVFRSYLINSCLN